VEKRLAGGDGGGDVGGREQVRGILPRRQKARQRVSTKQSYLNQSKYTWSDGSVYDGEWVDNKITGQGVYSWEDGRKYTGEWLQNNMNGFGLYIWLDGRKYEGNYLQDKKEG
jgi:hypothetical protein